MKTASIVLTTVIIGSVVVVGTYVMGLTSGAALMATSRDEAHEKEINEKVDARFAEMQHRCDLINAANGVPGYQEIVDETQA